MKTHLRTVGLAVLLLIPVLGCGTRPQAALLVDVTGRVIGPHGHGRANHAMTILGHATVVTDANGEFTVEDVVAPYTLVWGMRVEASPPSAPRIYVGLSQPNPTFQISKILWAPVNENVSGTIAPEEDAALAVLASAGHPHFIRSHEGDFTGDYGFNVAWEGPSTTPLTVRALQFSVGGDGCPDSYVGYGATSSVLNEGTGLTALALTLGPVATSTIAGTVSAPATTDAVSMGAWARWSHGDYHRLVNKDIGLTFSASIPDIPGVSHDVVVDVRGPGWFASVRRAGIAPGSSGVHVDVPIAARPLAPAPDGVIDDQTVLVADDFPGRSYLFILSAGYLDVLQDHPPGPRYEIYSGSPQVAIPDLSSIGVTLPPGTPYTLSVRSMGPYESLDEAVGPQGMHTLDDDGQFSTGSERIQVFTAN